MKRRGETFQARSDEVKMVNAALYLRRPLLVTGKPGTGKSSLAYAVARQLKLGEVLYWPVTTRTTLKEGLYSYDAIGRLQEVKQQERLNNQTFSSEQYREQIQQIEKYITLGPLGTALLPSKYPRVLLIDEIDKSDIDLPNNLLTVLEEGLFEIPELVRIKKEVNKVTVRTAYSDETEAETGSQMEAQIENGRITCTAFPLVVMTSNGERDFPAPFLRRCLPLRMKSPTQEELTKIVIAHFNQNTAEQEKIQALIKQFIEAQQDEKTLATDQLLNAIFMVTKGRIPATEGKSFFDDELVQQLLQDLGRAEAED